MASKAEIAEQGKNNASLVVNNAFIDGLSAQLKEKQQYGLSFPADYNPTNALMGAYLIMKETTDKNGKNILESCTQTSIANSLMDMVTLGLNASKKQGYFIAYGGKCQFQKSYFGNVTIAKRNGLKEINADVIYEGDEVVITTSKTYDKAKVFVWKDLESMIPLFEAEEVSLN